MGRSRAEFRALWLVLGLVLAPFAAAAEPRSIGDCESVKQADAYNRCLATFGPAAHTGGRNVTPPAAADFGPASGGEKPAPAARQRRGRAVPSWLAARQAEGRRRMEARRRTGVAVERKGGRVRAVIDVGKK